ARVPLEDAGGEPSGPAAPTDGPEAALGREAYRLYQQGRVAEACERYRELASRLPGDAGRRDLGACLTQLGRLAHRAGQWDLAIDHYRRAIDTYPRAPSVWMALAVTLARAQDHDRAQEVLEQAARSFGDDADLLYLLAQVQERRGRMREAGDTLRRLLAANPDHAGGRRLLAVVEREQKVEGAYWSQESKHFLVRYEGAGGLDVGRSVVDSLEDAHESIGRDLEAFPAHRVQVGIYSTQVLGQVIGVPAHFIAGAFDGYKIRLNLGETVAYSNDLSRLVRHEYAHAAIHIASSGRAPTWVHEGLAQVLEPRSAPRRIEADVPREHLTLRGIERLSRTMHPAALAAGYGLTHAAVEHMVDRGGMRAMRDFLGRLGKGQPLAEAMQQAFGFGPDEIEARIATVAGKS
ncbi:MAG: tetratricopeptide repeat protein, partial [Candidatus Rokuibacteriota bacterium]